MALVSEFSAWFGSWKCAVNLGASIFLSTAHYKVPYINWFKKEISGATLLSSPSLLVTVQNKTIWRT